jgi:hypothetical protein
MFVQHTQLLLLPALSVAHLNEFHNKLQFFCFFWSGHGTVAAARLPCDSYVSIAAIAT